jgi:hypothetical protein
MLANTCPGTEDPNEPTLHDILSNEFSEFAKVYNNQTNEPELLPAVKTRLPCQPLGPTMTQSYTVMTEDTRAGDSHKRTAAASRRVRRLKRAYALRKRPYERSGAEMNVNQRYHHHYHKYDLGFTAPPRMLLPVMAVQETGMYFS